MTASMVEVVPAMQPLLACAAALALKMVSTAFMTANARRKAGVIVNAEDAKVTPGAHVEATDAPSVLRYKRAHLNDLENIPMFLILATLFVMAGASKNAGWAYCGTFTAARYLHTITYLKELQPWRTIAFGIGQLCVAGLVVQLLMKAF